MGSFRVTIIIDGELHFMPYSGEGRSSVAVCLHRSSAYASLKRPGEMWEVGFISSFLSSLWLWHHRAKKSRGGWLWVTMGGQWILIPRKVSTQ